MKIGAATRIYIAGGGGMLGDAVYRHFAPIAQVKATDINVNEAWITRADVRDYREMRESISGFGPDVIINLAAMTDLEECEREPENAWATNAIGAKNLGLIANQLDAVYVYISTAGVFDGLLDAYTDADRPNPVSQYGKSKYFGERFVSDHVAKHYVPRASWMMGGGLVKDKKFVNKIYRQICDGRRELWAVGDKFGTLTYTIDLARGLHGLLESGAFGVYNHGGEGLCSRYDVACEFVRLLGLERAVSVTKVDSSFFSHEYSAIRPATEALINEKLRARGLNTMRDWRECLREYSEVFSRDLAQQVGLRR